MSHKRITDNKYIYYAQFNLTEELKLIDSLDDPALVGYCHLLSCAFLQNKGKLPPKLRYKTCSALSSEEQKKVDRAWSSLDIDCLNDRIAEILARSSSARSSVSSRYGKKGTNVGTNVGTNEGTIAGTFGVTKDKDKDKVKDKVDLPLPEPSLHHTKFAGKLQ